METSSVTFLWFAAFSGLRIFSYLPQIRRVARDADGASAIFLLHMGFVDRGKYCNSVIRISEISTLRS